MAGAAGGHDPGKIVAAPAAAVALGTDGGLVTVGLDATIVIAHSPALGRPTWKRTFGFHPMTTWAGHGQDGNGEPLASMLPGNAGSDTAADPTIRKEQPRARGTPPTRRDSRAASHGRHQKTPTSRTDQASTSRTR